MLDVGAGTGGPARWLGDHYGWRTVAAEPSGASLATARAFFPGLPLLRCEASRLPVPGRAVDAALLIGVLSLVDDLVARHVERTPHGREAACPAAFDAERAARGVLGDAIDGGTLVRVTLVAEAVGAPGGRARRDAGARRAPGPGPSGGPPSR